jgi:hypothetical protein
MNERAVLGTARKMEGRVGRRAVQLDPSPSVQTELDVVLLHHVARRALAFEPTMAQLERRPVGRRLDEQRRGLRHPREAKAIGAAWGDGGELLRPIRSPGRRAATALLNLRHRYEDVGR